MADRTLPTPETLRQLLRYDPETGKLYWKPRGEEWFPCDWSFKIWNKRYAQKEAFLVEGSNGKSGTLLYKNLYAHRVIWAMVYDEWPKFEIDHINRNNKDNRLSNLREATSQQNKMNRAGHKGATSKVAGVSFCKRTEKWVAMICKDRKQQFLGRYNTEEEAIAVRRKAEKYKFGEYAPIGDT